jgi:hypothetical protein
MLSANLSEVCAWKRAEAESKRLFLRGKIPMAQAPAANPTDDLLSQLAASEIDRLLAESDKPSQPEKPAPAVVAAPEAVPVSTPPIEAITDGPERQALLKAAGFESSDKPPSDKPAADAGSGDQPSGDERSALLKAAGFESVEDALNSSDSLPAPAAGAEIKPNGDFEKSLPIYLKPLVWINAPLESCSEKTRHILGTIGIATFVNALAVLTYLFIHHKH